MDNKKLVAQDLEQVSNALTAANQIRNIISKTDHGGFLAVIYREVVKEIDRLYDYEGAVKDYITNKTKRYETKTQK